MKIVYFNYISNAIGPMIRTLEIAKACSDNNIYVVLHFMRKDFNPPEFIFDRIREYQGEKLKIYFPPIHDTSLNSQSNETTHSVNVAPMPPKMSAFGLLRQGLLSLRYIFQEIKIIHYEKPDAIMARPDDAFSFCFSGKITKTPIVLDTDGPVEELDLYWGVYSKYFKIFDSFRARSSNAVLCISRVCRDLWIDKQLDIKKLFIVPNGANPDEFSPQASEQRKILKLKNKLDGSRVIGFSGNQRVWHGLPNLLISSLVHLKANKDIKLLIIGCGKNIKMLEECNIPDKIIKNQIIFTGQLSYTDMAKYIDLADIMVMPYDILKLFYFSPMRMFEAMSAGKLLITSKQGQMQDILGEQSAVIFFDPEKEGDLERILGNAIYDDELIATGVRNRDYLLASHTWKHRGQEISNALIYAINDNYTKS